MNFYLKHKSKTVCQRRWRIVWFAVDWKWLTDRYCDLYADLWFQWLNTRVGIEPVTFRSVCTSSERLCTTNCDSVLPPLPPKRATLSSRVMWILLHAVVFYPNLVGSNTPFAIKFALWVALSQSPFALNPSLVFVLSNGKNRIFDEGSSTLFESVWWNWFCVKLLEFGHR